MKQISSKQKQNQDEIDKYLDKTSEFTAWMKIHDRFPADLQRQDEEAKR